MFRPFRYIPSFVLPVLAYVAFTSGGWMTFLPILEAFLLVPVLELLIPPDRANVDKEEEKRLLASPVYDALVYLVIPVHLYLLWLFVMNVGHGDLVWWEMTGMVASMGLLCGVFGINVAHELGHRKNEVEQFLAKIMLLTSLYMHFFIEHNRGHHRYVGTPEDPSTAREGEALYRFWIRSVSWSFVSAWRLECKRLRRKGYGCWTWRNEMIVFQLAHASMIVLVWYAFGVTVLAFFVLAAVFGFLLLETVNYIEHYGLRRARHSNGYERVMPKHSWNSDHMVGRMLLFELSRHSDHHYKSSRKYQILRHMDESPQMPTGYPGMMIMALIPPLWFGIMDSRLKGWNAADTVEAGT